LRNTGHNEIFLNAVSSTFYFYEAVPVAELNRLILNKNPSQMTTTWEGHDPSLAVLKWQASSSIPLRGTCAELMAVL